MPYVLRYQPDPPTMPPEYDYKDEYYADLAKPRSRRRKRNDATLRQSIPNHHRYDQHRIPHNNSLIKSYPYLPEYKRNRRRLDFDYEDYDDYHHRHHDDYDTTRSEPPVVLVPFNKRARRRQRPHTEDFIEVRIEPGYRRNRVFDPHVHTHRSSKGIPSMKYDRLHCPHCETYVQPNKNDVITYPWTVVNQPLDTGKAASLPPLYPMTIVDQSAPATETKAASVAVTKAASVAATNQNASDLKTSTVVGQGANFDPVIKEPEGKDVKGAKPDTSTAKQRQEKEDKLSKRLSNISKADKTKNADNAPSRVSVGVGRSRVSVGVQYSAATHRPRPLFGTREHAVGYRGTYVNKDNDYFPPPVREVMNDDVTPDDSVSNILIPVASRPYFRDYKRTDFHTGRRRDDVRALSEVDEDYPRERYFESVRVPHPGHAPITPPPIREQQRDGRVFRGEYYDRHADRWYQYDVNMGQKNNVQGERRPRGVYR